MFRKITLLIVLIFVLSAALSAQFLNATLLSTHLAGNNRYPGICENDKGERLAIFRQNTNGMFFTVYKNGKWSTPAQIPRQEKQTGEFLGSDIVADSQGRFHVVWELMDEAAYYANYKDGVWSDVEEINFPGKYEGFQICLDIRSNDELVISGTAKPSRILKDCFIGFKSKTEKNFGRFINISDDAESSGSAAIAVDEEDNVWMTWKGEQFGGEEILLTCVVMIDRHNNVVKSSFKKASEEQEGWSFLQWAAHNKNGKLMVTWWKNPGFFCRLYDSETKHWSDIITIPLSTDRKPDFSMWSKVVAQNQDFYFLAKDRNYNLHLIKYDTAAGAWGEPRMITPDSVFYYDIFAGYDNILVTWCARKEPTQIYTATLPVEPQIRVKSVGLLQPAKQLERSFFRNYYFNIVSWANNPFNVEHNIDVTHFNLYRRVQGSGNFPETPLMSRLPVATLRYEDVAIDPLLTYEYYVTCIAQVNGKEIESKITE
jgi:hypothetical protein